MSEFWLSEKSSRVFEIVNAKQKTIYPYVAELIKQTSPKAMLDYGCGYSFISHLINKDIEIGLYDINIERAKIAAQHLVDRNCKVFNTAEEIHNNYYDFIIFSFVLTCLNSRDEFLSILQNFKNSKKKDAKLIIVTTHPCFREHKYRHFHSEYAISRQFEYFKNHEPFELFLHNEANGNDIQFTDYHWTLSETINTLMDSGFRLEKLLEVHDDIYEDKPCNLKYPPYMVLICK